MAKTIYKLEIDCFSGRPNPKFEITEDDFAALYRDILSLETTTPSSLYDGLGFRGFVLSDSVAKFISIQQNIIKIAINKSVQYKKNNQVILSRLFRLAGQYDKERTYETLIERITGNTYYNEKRNMGCLFPEALSLNKEMAFTNLR